MIEWFLSAGLGWVAWLVIIIIFYVFASGRGAAKVNDKIQKQKNKDDKKLKEVADEADRVIANGDTNDRMRNNNWFRKQR